MSYYEVRVCSWSHSKRCLVGTLDNHHLTSVFFQHIILDYDYNDTGSGSGSGELGVDLEEPCGVEHIMTADLQRVFLPVVYALIFILGITGNGLVVIVLGCQRR